MPEGDSIATDALRLRPILVGEEIVGAESRWPRMVRKLAGTRVTAVDHHGKHLLVRFDDDTLLRVHLGMKGRWHRLRHDQRWPRDRGALGVLLATADWLAVCFFPPEVERIAGKAVPTHRVLSQLGPCLLGGDAPDPDRLVAAAHAEPQQEVAETLLDQWIAAGIGNVYKSELLFRARISPFRPVGEVPPEAVAAIYRDARELLERNVGTGSGRNTTGLGPGRPNLWVYGRARRQCLRCGTPVRAAKQGPWRRVTYWCPACQAR